MISRAMYEELLDYLESIKDVEIDTAGCPDIGARDMLESLRNDHDHYHYEATK